MTKKSNHGEKGNKGKGGPNLHQQSFYEALMKRTSNSDSSMVPETGKVGGAKAKERKEKDMSCQALI